MIGYFSDIARILADFGRAILDHPAGVFLALVVLFFIRGIIGLFIGSLIGDVLYG